MCGVHEAGEDHVRPKRPDPVDEEEAGDGLKLRIDFEKNLAVVNKSVPCAIDETALDTVSLERADGLGVVLQSVVRPKIRAAQVEVLTPAP